MEEQEAPLEEVHESIHHHAEHARERWVLGVALSTAVLAALAAIASLVSGDYVNEAMLEQIQASDTWAHYQADGIKATELETRIALLESAGKPIDPKVRARAAEYRGSREELAGEARELKDGSARHMKRHHIVSTRVTFAQIAIAVSAVSVLTRQRWFWFLGMGLGAAGLARLIYGLMV